MNVMMHEASVGGTTIGLRLVTESGDEIDYSSGRGLTMAIEDSSIFTDCLADRGAGCAADHGGDRMSMHAIGETPPLGLAIPICLQCDMSARGMTDRQGDRQPTDIVKGKGAVMSTGLTQFLMERIAEDEAAASAVKDIRGEAWDVEVMHALPGRDPRVAHWPDHERTTLAQQFDPARVLAVCDMTRLIMAIHTAYEPTGKPACAPEWSENDWCVGCCYNSDEERITEHIDDCPILRALALPFANHPDFRDEWNP